MTDLHAEVLAVFRDAQLGYDPAFFFDDDELATGEWSTIDAATHRSVEIVD